MSSIPSRLCFFYSVSPARLSLRRRPIHCGMREIRDRISSVQRTLKITEAMKLVSAAKIRRAQEAVISSRPFTETLLEVLYDLKENLLFEDVDVPLTNVRPVKKVALVVITSDRGLCGAFNNAITKRTENRITELQNLGLDYTVISVGKKGSSYFRRRPHINLGKCIEREKFPTAKEAQAVADGVFSIFVTEEVDKVELIYTKFVSLLNPNPNVIIRTLLPLLPFGGICDAYGNRVDAEEDEIFKLTTKEGKLIVERDKSRPKQKGLSPLMQFEQDPAQIMDALMPLYLNSQILRALQESLASELAARRNAMANATKNGMELNQKLRIAYNRERQGKITNGILEISAAAEALN